MYCSFFWLLVKYGFGTAFAGAGLLAALLGVLEFQDMRRELRERRPGEAGRLGGLAGSFLSGLCLPALERAGGFPGRGTISRA